MTTDKVSPDTLQEAYDKFFNVLSHRRSRRAAIGGKITEYFRYKSSESVIPLTKEETALLCFAGAGQTGLISGDLPGAPAMVYLHGRSFPSPCNSQKTHLLFANDEGIFLYEPRPTNKVVRVQGPADLQEVIDTFDKDVVKLEGVRGDLNPAFMGAPEYVNCKGQTTFFPIVQPSEELIGMLAISLAGKMPCLFIDDQGKPAGIERWIDKLSLKIKVPVTMLEQQINDWCTLEAGLITQNILLAAEAMGLGAFPFSGFASLMLMGGTPLTRGMRFRFITDKKGSMNPVGIDGVLEGYCPPYWKDMGEAVQSVIKRRFEEGGAYDPGTDSSLLDQMSYANNMPKIPSEVIECCKDLCTWMYNRAGRFPMNHDAMTIPIGVGAHHVALEFYEKFNKPEFVTDMHQNHMAKWHPA